MPFLLEYATDHSAGWFIVAGATSTDAAAKAVHALRGLEGTHAVLRQTTRPHPPFGVGPVMAAYYQERRVHQARSMAAPVTSSTSGIGLSGLIGTVVLSSGQPGHVEGDVCPAYSPR